jgi:GTP pyrophosphokinase
VPGEPIIGFLTRGNGVTIHAAVCKALIGLDPERFIEVSWDRAEANKEITHEIFLEVLFKPTKGALSRIVAALSEEVIDIIEVQANESKSGRLLFKVAVRDFVQCQAAVKTLTDLTDFVERVSRHYPEEDLEAEDEVVD